MIVKPNYEGSSKGIGDDAIARDGRALAEMLPKALRRYPTGVIVEEFIAGNDVTVPFIEGLGDEGVLLPVDYVIDPGARSRFNIYDYRLKSTESNRVSVRCPPDLPRDVLIVVFDKGDPMTHGRFPLPGDQPLQHCLRVLILWMGFAGEDKLNRALGIVN